MELSERLSLLAGSARYDASCASSGSIRRREPGGIGNAAACGICHSYTEDGRCVSLFKILLTNHCVYDCAYCINRESNDIRRTALTTRELVELTLHFYQRNYIEGLFLSSGIFQSPDATMERLVRVARELREKHRFCGYIHLKCIPGASEDLLRQAGVYADRLSVNIEIPTDENLRRLTARKSHDGILKPMGVIRDSILESRDEYQRFTSAPIYAPAGQSTQLVIGATPESDYEILRLADRLYRLEGLRRVYYSAYVSVNPMDSRLPACHEPPLRRENRLYQADWLLRLYGFELEDLLTPSQPHLALDADPKLAYALGHSELFPVDINRAEREMLLRVPGIGLRGAGRILELRRQRCLHIEHLRETGIVVKRALPFIVCPGMSATPSSTSLGASKTRSSRRSTTVPRSHCKAPPENCPTVIYGGGFAGLLSAIFDIFSHQWKPDRVLPRGSPVQMSLNEKVVSLNPDAGKAARVWHRFGEIFGEAGRKTIYRAHLSGEGVVGHLVYGAVAETIRGMQSATSSSSSDYFRQLESLSSRVGREAHRMRGLLRFEEVSKGFLAASINPRYDVIPLIQDHFEQRYAGRQWMIYDICRDHGLYYDGVESHMIRIDWESFRAAHRGAAEELNLQYLWKKYYDALGIPERANNHLHLQKLPRRYWPLLPEKRSSANHIDGQHFHEQPGRPPRPESQQAAGAGPPG